jgi:hypothetical protein
LCTYFGSHHANPPPKKKATRTLYFSRRRLDHQRRLLIIAQLSIPHISVSHGFEFVPIVFFFLDECQVVCGIRCRINTPAHNAALLNPSDQFESKRRAVDVDDVIMMKWKTRQMLAAPWTGAHFLYSTQVSPPPTYVAVHPGSRVTHAAAPRVTSARDRDAASAGVPALVHRITTPVIAMTTGWFELAEKLSRCDTGWFELAEKLSRCDLATSFFSFNFFLFYGIHNVNCMLAWIAWHAIHALI